MKGPRLRLIVAAVLLFGWLGWLGYLAATKTNPVILSRSQVMASSHFVLAKVSLDASTGLPVREVEIVEDLRPNGEPVAGTVRIANLPEARVAGTTTAFSEPGTYLLMLTKTLIGYELTLPPRSPGHDGPARLQPWAYVWSAPGVQQQFEALVPRR